MTIPDYYGEAIKKAYQRESLRSHPDRFPNATPEESRAHTQRFQSVADASRRAEYDRMRTQQGYASDADDASTQDESARFFRMFGGADAQEQPHAQDLFANVLEEMLRPEVERHSTVSGFVLGYIVANWPGGTYAPLTQPWAAPHLGIGSARCAMPKGNRSARYSCACPGRNARVFFVRWRSKC